MGEHINEQFRRIGFGEGDAVAMDEMEKHGDNGASVPIEEAFAWLDEDIKKAEKAEALDEPELTESEARKRTPIYSGVLQYFPDAIAAVARQSWQGNNKHNPGEPLHWARDKSSDHMDCIARHLMTPDEIDPESNETHLVAVVWRALAALQIQQEKLKGIDAEGKNN